jgi:hypothetical protein
MSGCTHRLAHAAGPLEQIVADVQTEGATESVSDELSSQGVQFRTIHDRLEPARSCSSFGLGESGGCGRVSRRERSGPAWRDDYLA